jgi:hypothetical protein
MVMEGAWSQGPAPESPSQIRLRFELGQGFSQYIERRDRRITDPAIVDYVQSIENRLARAAGIKPLEVRITASSEMYTYLPPHGVLYISAGFFERLENEAELGGLLAHGLAHVRESLVPVPGYATVRVFAPACVLSSKIIQHRRSDEQRTLELDATKFAVHTLETAGYDPSGVLDLLSKAAYEHPAWAKAIIPDDLMDLRAIIENAAPPLGGYLLDSSEFVQQHSRIVAALGHTPRKIPTPSLFSSALQ